MRFVELQSEFLQVARQRKSPRRTLGEACTADALSAACYVQSVTDVGLRHHQCHQYRAWSATTSTGSIQFLLLASDRETVHDGFAASAFCTRAAIESSTLQGRFGLKLLHPTLQSDVMAGKGLLSNIGIWAT